jgi:hypothetical protein
MNHEVRLFLIEQSRKGRPIYYEDVAKVLKIDLSFPEQRQILSTTLGEISTFEFENNRPMISSMAIYKAKNDHGFGFYNLCEELGIGKSTKLEKELYGFDQMEKCKKFWQNKSNYDTYANLNEENDDFIPSFFAINEIEFLSGWVNKVYDQSDEHKAAKDYLMSSLGTKTQYWSNQLVKSLPEFETYNPRIWSQPGWDKKESGRIRVSRFKPYTWARIFKEGDRHKDIFFTVGVDGNTKELVYKLDYYFEKSSKLSAEQQELIERNIPTELRRITIPLSKITEYNWDKLIDETKEFIAVNSAAYDRLVNLVWGISKDSEVFTQTLRKHKRPEGLDQLPEFTPSFSGTNKDYLKEARDLKELGDAGEELVIQFEKDRLRSLGLSNLANQVRKVKDGEGYDILSYHEDETVKNIEVKTTTSNKLTPFYYTATEKAFADANPQKYVIYRLFNFDGISNTADFFEIVNPSESLHLRTEIYSAYLKKESE